MTAAVRVVLQPVLYVGLGAVAFWVHLCLPKLRPESVSRTMLEIGTSFATVMALPLLLAISLGFVGGRGGVLAFLLVATMPALCRLLLRRFWLLGRIVGDASGGTPRGGHPATATSR